MQQCSSRGAALTQPRRFILCLVLIRQLVAFAADGLEPLARHNSRHLREALVIVLHHERWRTAELCTSRRCMDASLAVLWDLSHHSLAKSGERRVTCRASSARHRLDLPAEMERGASLIFALLVAHVHALAVAAPRPVQAYAVTPIRHRLSGDVAMVLPAWAIATLSGTSASIVSTLVAGRRGRKRALEEANTLFLDNGKLQTEVSRLTRQVSLSKMEVDRVGAKLSSGTSLSNQLKGAVEREQEALKQQASRHAHAMQEQKAAHTAQQKVLMEQLEAMAADNHNLTSSQAVVVEGVLEHAQELRRREMDIKTKETKELRQANKHLAEEVARERLAKERLEVESEELNRHLADLHRQFDEAHVANHEVAEAGGLEASRSSDWRMVRVKLPPNVKPGALCAATLPGEWQVQVEAPANAYPGMVVEMDAAIMMEMAAAEKEEEVLQVEVEHYYIENEEGDAQPDDDEMMRRMELVMPLPTKNKETALVSGAASAEVFGI